MIWPFWFHPGECHFINIICKINVNKSPGPDNIHPRLQKETSSQIALPLKLIFDKSLTLGEIPKSWKIAEVRPIFKKGDKTDPGNYRPVSLTCIVCKIMKLSLKKPFTITL